jgi:hypothetical protein
MKNKNAFIGMNVEQLIKNSIVDHPAVIEISKMIPILESVKLAEYVI